MWGCRRGEGEEKKIDEKKRKGGDVNAWEMEMPALVDGGAYVRADVKSPTACRWRTSRRGRAGMKTEAKTKQIRPTRPHGRSRERTFRLEITKNILREKKNIYIKRIPDDV